MSWFLLRFAAIILMVAILIWAVAKLISLIWYRAEESLEKAEERQQERARERERERHRLRQQRLEQGLKPGQDGRSRVEQHLHIEHYYAEYREGDQAEGDIVKTERH